MKTHWILLFGVLALTWTWLDALRARERAIGHGHRLCKQAGVQLLDQTVSLMRLRLVRDSGLPALARRYAFEVSLTGSDRHRGHLDLIGHRLSGWSMPLPADADAAPPAAPSVSLRGPT